MKVTFENSSEYREFLGSDFDDTVGYGTNRERRFDHGAQVLTNIGDDLDLDLEEKWFGDEELEDLGLIRH